MKPQISVEERVRQLLKKDSRYDRDAYEFISNALTFTLSHSPKEPKRKHVTGQELSEGIRQYALQEFGPLAREVLRHWGLNATDDFGEIVYNLIEIGLMGKSDEDRREDFHNVFDLDTAFEEGFHIQLTEEELEL